MSSSAMRDPFPWESTLDPGEAEAIALALEVSARRIVLDDRPARRTAEQLGLLVIGSLGVLLEGHRQGLVSNVRAELDAMIDAGFYVGKALYAEVLALARELG